MSYTPPKVWEFEKITMGGKFGGTNRPTAGARSEFTLPKGEFDYQLYSLNTPNGIKVNMLLEELKALGKIDGYDAFKIDIMTGEQFSSGFVEINQILRFLPLWIIPLTRPFLFLRAGRFYCI